MYKWEESILNTSFTNNSYLYNVESNLFNPNTIELPYGLLDENGELKWVNESKSQGPQLANVTFTEDSGLMQSNGDIRYVNPVYTLKYDEYFGALWNSDLSSAMYYSYIYPISVHISGGTKQVYQGWGRWKETDSPDDTYTDEDWLKKFRSVATTDYSRNKSLSAAYGLQVRCVVE